jgi:hypothetical protein
MVKYKSQISQNPGLLLKHGDHGSTIDDADKIEGLWFLQWTVGQKHSALWEGSARAGSALIYPIYFANPIRPEVVATAYVG